MDLQTWIGLILLIVSLVGVVLLEKTDPNRRKSLKENKDEKESQYD